MAGQNIDPGFLPPNAIERLKTFVEENGIKILNVAGPGRGNSLRLVDSSIQRSTKFSDVFAISLKIVAVSAFLCLDG